jgi:3,4-dihydroxy 2-butanone 4-phosphate synthase/GTP cyclohydrolase II
MKDDGTMARGKDLFIFAKKHKLRIAKIEDLISYRLKKEKLIKLKKNLEIKIQDQNFKLKIFENKINGSEHLAFTKGQLGSKIVPKVRVISSNLLLQNILIGGKLPDTFNKTMKYFKKFKNCVLVFINENNLSLNNVSFKSNKVVSKSKENKKEYLIKNYGIGAQILKELKIRKMTLLTKTPKNVVGLDGFGIKILNQEIIS